MQIRRAAQQNIAPAADKECRRHAVQTGITHGGQGIERVGPAAVLYTAIYAPNPCRGLRVYPCTCKRIMSCGRRIANQAVIENATKPLLLFMIFVSPGTGIPPKSGR
jgi:hypothetical protein